MFHLQFHWGMINVFTWGQLSYFGVLNAETIFTVLWTTVACLRNLAMCISSLPSISGLWTWSLMPIKQSWMASCSLHSHSKSLKMNYGLSKYI